VKPLPGFLRTGRIAIAVVSHAVDLVVKELVVVYILKVWGSTDLTGGVLRKLLNYVPPGLEVVTRLLHKKTMALHLDGQTRPYLERLFKNVREGDFIGKRVQKMLVADRERLEMLSACEHEADDFTGKKTCCGKCGAFYEAGMYEEWISNSIKRSVMEDVTTGV